MDPIEKTAEPSRLLKVIIAAIALTTLFVASQVFPVREWLAGVIDWTRELGPAGYLFFVIAYVFASLLFLPGSILSLGAGATFGVFGGFVAVSIGSTLGAAAAFLAGRFIARDFVAARVEGNARFTALDDAVGREGFKIVLLTRLSPVFPFNLLNYAYGLTKVRFWPYVLASWIGMMPGALVVVYLGAAAKELAMRPEGTTDHSGLALKLVGLAATIVVTVFVAKLARKALADAAKLE